MRELRARDPQAERWLMVPEAAPLLFQAGLKAYDTSFQRAVVRLQIALEDACAEAAQPGQNLLCHRGTLDALAYWLHNGWDKETFSACVGRTLEELLLRYDLVLHLQTVAIGAQENYRGWPEAHRPETLEQAQEIDSLCAHVWRQHPRFILIENAGQGWHSKVATAFEALQNWFISGDSFLCRGQ